MGGIYPLPDIIVLVEYKSISLTTKVQEIVKYNK